MTILARLKTYAAFIKLEHTLFSLPLLYAGAVLGRQGLPPLKLALLILAAGLGGRTVAMGLNRILDRALDAQNPRTATRELPRGRMGLGEAWGVVGAGLVLYLLSAALIAPICLLLSPIPVLLFLSYPYLKRWTSLSHLGLGLVWTTAPVGGWIAANPEFKDPLAAILLAGFSLFWLAGFDIIYATLDETFDREHQLHSLPAQLGRESALRVSAVFHLLAFGFMLGLYGLTLHSAGALPFLVLVAVLFYLQHRKAQDVNLAFFKLNAILGFVVFGFILAGVWPGA